jgi:uncharacterized protein (DUF983 family)
MTRRRGKRGVEIQWREPIVEERMPEGDPPAAIKPSTPVPVVGKVYQKCPHCGSVRSVLRYSRLQRGFRQERRKCKACLKEFDVRDYSKRATPE